MRRVVLPNLHVSSVADVWASYEYGDTAEVARHLYLHNAIVVSPEGAWKEHWAPYLEHVCLKLPIVQCLAKGGVLGPADSYGVPTQRHESSYFPSRTTPR